MFGDLMGDMQEKQKELRKELAKITVEADSGDGAIKVEANANREIVNISINRDAIDWEDTEQVEDLLMVAINRALEKAAEKEAAESQRLIQDLLPPGLGNLGNLFG